MMSDDVPQHMQAARGRDASPLTDDRGRRGLILRAAEESFARLGFVGTSLNHVCEGAGIAKATVYHYFPSKTAILHQLMYEYMAEQMEAAESPHRRRLSPPDRLLELMRDIVGSLDTHRGTVRCFYENLIQILPTELGDQVTEIRERYNQHIEYVLISGRDAGVFVFENVRMTRLNVFALCAWPFTWYREGAGVTTDELATNAWNLVMDGIRP